MSTTLTCATAECTNTVHGHAPTALRRSAAYTRGGWTTVHHLARAPHPDPSGFRLVRTAADFCPNHTPPMLFGRHVHPTGLRAD